MLTIGEFQHKLSKWKILVYTLTCDLPVKDNVNDQIVNAKTEILSSHPSHSDYEREVLSVYGKFLTLS